LISVNWQDTGTKTTRLSGYLKIEAECAIRVVIGLI
jgi:hypothetical protein